MTEQEGVTEAVAESQQQESQPNDQEVNWRKANETMAQQKQELEQLKQQNALLQRWAENQNQAQQQVAQPANPLDSMSEDDVLTVGEFKGAFSTALEQEKAAMQRELQEVRKQQTLMQYRSQYSDYDNVIANTMKLAEQDPALAEAIASSKNPQLLAYRLGKPEYERQQQEAQKAQRMLENAAKPGSVANASTGGSGISSVDMILNMSDEEFEKRIASVKRGGG